MNKVSNIANKIISTNQINEKAKKKKEEDEKGNEIPEKIQGQLEQEQDINLDSSLKKIQYNKINTQSINKLNIVPPIYKEKVPITKGKIDFRRLVYDIGNVNKGENLADFIKADNLIATSGVVDENGRQSNYKTDRREVTLVPADYKKGYYIKQRTSTRLANPHHSFSHIFTDSPLNISKAVSHSYGELPLKFISHLLSQHNGDISKITHSEEQMVYKSIAYNWMNSISMNDLWKASILEHIKGEIPNQISEVFYDGEYFPCEDGIHTDSDNKSGIMFVHKDDLSNIISGQLDLPTQQWKDAVTNNRYAVVTLESSFARTNSNENYLFTSIFERIPFPYRTAYTSHFVNEKSFSTSKVFTDDGYQERREIIENGVLKYYKPKNLKFDRKESRREIVEEKDEQKADIKGQQIEGKDLSKNKITKNLEEVFQEYILGIINFKVAVDIIVGIKKNKNSNSCSSFRFRNI
jgi:hypothetical protein